MTEFEIIRRFFTHRASGSLLGVGDDAALVRVASGMDLAVSADMLLEGRHFLRGADPALLGHKSLAVNLSDMAAMGAKPRWATLAIALPRANAGWIAAYARGFMRLARKYRVDLIGGDTTRGPLSICVQILGELPKGAALRRDGARPGDDVWVSGELGGAALGLAGLQRRLSVSRTERRALEHRLNAPEPRVALGLALRRIASSAIDVSDGLVADLGHICERSGVRAVVHWESLPASPYARRLAQLSDLAARAILAGGDDYELCFTAPPARRADIARAARRARTPVAMVGRVERRARSAPLVQVLDSIGKPFRVRAEGFDHFR
ncbi:MAG TPA: thiamine-phosphate kinase [Burkholderiales bacterium]|nr:thiamine-phosphate kinase [Burkholderiales bacterium]